MLPLTSTTVARAKGRASRHQVCSVSAMFSMGGVSRKDSRLRRARAAVVRSAAQGSDQSNASAVMGSSRTRRPVALKTALAMAGATPTMDDLAEALDAERVGFVVLAVEVDRLEVGDVGVDGDEVVGEVGVDDPAVAVVGDRVLQQGRADAADHAADGLAVGELGADDAARVVHAEHPPHPHQAEAARRRRPRRRSRRRRRRSTARAPAARRRSRRASRWVRLLRASSCW